jgi:hypothetical protein
MRSIRRNFQESEEAFKSRLEIYLREVKQDEKKLREMRDAIDSRSKHN